MVIYTMSVHPNNPNRPFTDWRVKRKFQAKYGNESARHELAMRSINQSIKMKEYWKRRKENEQRIIREARDNQSRGSTSSSA